MDAKEILKKIKAVFDGTTVVPPVAPPAAAPAVPARLATNFPVDGGGAVYIDGSTIDVGTAVWTDEALTMPYPDGSYMVTGTDFTFTVTGGTVSVVAGTLNAAAPLPVLPPPPAPMFPTIPQFEAMEKDIAELKALLIKSNLLAEKHEKILPDLFELTEKLTEIPASDPKTLNGKQQEKFDYAASRDERINAIAKTLKKIKN
jgi:hypothetical protein